MLKILAFFIPGGKILLRRFQIPMMKKDVSEFFYQIITSALAHVSTVFLCKLKWIRSFVFVNFRDAKQESVAMI